MRRISDIVLAIFVVAIAGMLVIPLPTFLLDILLVINISFSLLLLLVGIYMPNALALLAFPSLLLLATLFRLGLNVASTRLILSQADAGSVIQSFGTFLVRGEVVVGVIIFCIITIVNFIVIARGSSRVSEVAARFALDALPGKQLAIDSELRSGNISAEDARHRREELRKESQLYGSMDGAMKFVQGDAIAGFFIILTNILGGIYIGVSRNQSVAEAVSTYTVLTVGDGLVNQIPALLISICAGIVVTRVYSAEGTTLGGDLGSQLFARPAAVALTGGILLLLGLMPGLPNVPFATVGIFMIASGAFLKRSMEREALAAPLKLDVPTGSVMLLSAPGSDDELSEDARVEVSLDSGVLYKLYRQQMQRYSAWWQELRNDFYNEIGMRLPELTIISADHLAPSSYSVSFNGSKLDSEGLLLDAVLVESLPENAELFGLEVLRPAVHPLTGSRIFWAARNGSQKMVCEAAQLRCHDFFEYIGLKIAAFFTEHPEEAFSLSEVYSSLKLLEKKFPGLASDVFSRNFIDLPRLTAVFQELVKQDISVKDYKQIIEAVAGYCSINGIAIADSSHVVLNDIVLHVRMARRRQVTSRLLSRRGTLRVFSLSAEVEAALDDITADDADNTLAIEPELFEQLRLGLRGIVKPVLQRGIPPVTVLVRGDQHNKVQKLVFNCGEPVNVVTFDELDRAIDIERVGVWELPANG
ncbi:MAG: FHIPEP family type III secretion protein [Deltaproteobacteria bacterium]|nr:FHIPEP family type III secretion protein [Deltaproteobacteria bacterium]